MQTEVKHITLKPTDLIFDFFDNKILPLIILIENVVCSHSEWNTTVLVKRVNAIHLLHTIFVWIRKEEAFKIFQYPNIIMFSNKVQLHPL